MLHSNRNCTLCFVAETGNCVGIVSLVFNYEKTSLRYHMDYFSVI